MSAKAVSYSDDKIQYSSMLLR